MRLLHRGNNERTQESTAANKTSSRSHALLMVNVRQTARSRVAMVKGAVKSGRLYMIDLAGSERAAQTQVSRLKSTGWAKSTPDERNKTTLLQALFRR